MVHNTNDNFSTNTPLDLLEQRNTCIDATTHNKQCLTNCVETTSTKPTIFIHILLAMKHVDILLGLLEITTLTSGNLKSLKQRVWYLRYNLMIEKHAKDTSKQHKVCKVTQI